jgi:hypothetical protein
VLSRAAAVEERAATPAPAPSPRPAPPAGRPAR